MLTYSSILLSCIFPVNQAQSTLRRLAGLYFAFFVSGVIHMAGDAMITGKIVFKAFRFFMLQPFGIILELLVIYLWRRFSGSQGTTCAADGRGHGQLKGDAAPSETQVDGVQRERRNVYKESEEPIPPLWIRCMGFIWVIFWMAWTAPYIVDPLCAVGVFRDPRLNLG